MSATGTRLRAFVRRDLIDAASYKAAFAYQVITLVSSVLTVYFLSRMVAGADVPSLRPYGGDYFAFALIGVAFADYLAVSLASFSRGLRLAQRNGTLEAMLATPATPAQIVVGSALYRFLWSFARVVVYVLSGLVLGATFPEANLLSATVTAALSILAFGAVGVLGAALVLVLKAWEPVTAVFSGLSWLLGGVLYPVSSLPGVAQHAASLLPITHALEAMRGALLDGRGLGELVGPLAGLAIFAAVVLPVAVWVFSWSVRRVRMEGSVGHY